MGRPGTEAEYANRSIETFRSRHSRSISVEVKLTMGLLQLQLAFLIALSPTVRAKRALPA